MLKLNPGKTHVMTIGTEQRLRTRREHLEVIMDGVVLQEDPSNEEVLLGCHIQSNMKWSKQYCSLMLKLKKRVAGLEKIKYVVPFSVRKVIAEGVFNSVLIYCLPLFDGTEKVHIRNLQILQNRVTQIVCRAPPRTNRVFLLDKLGWMSVAQLIAYHTLLAIFKMKQTNEPEYLAEFLNTESRNGRIFLPNFQLQISQKSFLYRGSCLWNSLPFEIRRKRSMEPFKTSLKTWVKSNISQFVD